MSGHRGAIQSLSWSAESSVLVSGGLDCTVKCWDVKSSGGERMVGSMRADGTARGAGDAMSSVNERGGLPMGPGEPQWDEMNST
jgi:transcription initiation factor TFIID subunit 5